MLETIFTPAPHNPMNIVQSMSAPLPSPHCPVMGDQVIDQLGIKPDGVYLDATFGAGNMARAILMKGVKKLYCLDCDADSLKKYGEPLRQDYPHVVLCHSNFHRLAEIFPHEANILDGAVFDLGVSSMQLDSAERGFSFHHDGPLDMRMDQTADIPTARDLVNTASYEELADIFYRYGEEKQSRAIARKIIATRQESSLLSTTQDLANLVAGVKKSKGRIHPATQVFQALRIAVNDELTAIEKALTAITRLLKPDGRLVMITFHSLEDRIVKNFLKPKKSMVSRHQPSVPEKNNHPFTFVKLLTPSEAEIKQNPRSRSAKLRVAYKNPSIH